MGTGHVARLAATIRKYNLERFDEPSGWMELIEIDEVDEDMAEQLLFLCEPYVEQQKRRPSFLEPDPMYEDIYPNRLPDLVLGHLVDHGDIPVGINLRGACHCLFAGTTEMGKSVGIRRLVHAVEEYNASHKRKISVILLDRKGEHSDLARLSSCWRHFDVHSTLKLGLGPPFGVAADRWINAISEDFSARAGVIAARISMASLFRKILPALNNNGAAELLFPDFQLLLDAARHLPKSAYAEKPAYADTLVHWLEEVSQSSGDLFRCFRGLDVDRDLVANGLSAVISMPFVSPSWMSRFIADIIILQLLFGRSARGHLVDHVDTLVIIDEADEDVSAENEKYFQQSLSPIAKGMRMLREFGVGLVLAVGALNPVARHITNSARYKFVFGLTEGSCVASAVNTLSVNPRAALMFPTLDKGRCVARIPYWPHALYTQVDYVPPNR